MRYIITVEDDYLSQIDEVAKNLEKNEFSVESTLNIVGIIIATHNNFDETVRITGVKAIEAERIILL
jgi:hypothetical protein